MVATCLVLGSLGAYGCGVFGLGEDAVTPESYAQATDSVCSETGRSYLKDAKAFAESYRLLDVDTASTRVIFLDRLDEGAASMGEFLSSVQEVEPPPEARQAQDRLSRSYGTWFAALDRLRLGWEVVFTEVAEDGQASPSSLKRLEKAAQSAEEADSEVESRWKELPLGEECLDLLADLAPEEIPVAEYRSQSEKICRAQAQKLIAAVSRFARSDSRRLFEDSRSTERYLRTSEEAIKRVQLLRDSLGAIGEPSSKKEAVSEVDKMLGSFLARWSAFNDAFRDAVREYEKRGFIGPRNQERVANSEKRLDREALVRVEGDRIASRAPLGPACSVIFSG